jgi:acetylcholinesterase
LDAFRQSIEGNTITELYLRTYYPFVIDNYLLTDLPENLLKRGDFKRCPVLTGFTANEGSLTLAKSGLFGFKSTELKRQQNISHNDMANFLNEFFAYYPSYPHLMNKIISDLILHEYTKLTNLKDDLNLPIALMKTNYFQELSKIIADQSIVCPTYKLSDALAKYGSNVFLYLYSHRVSSSAWPVWYGAVNGDELAFTFGHTIANNNNKPRSVNSLNPWANSKHYYTNNEKILTKEMLGYWANFVRSGDPNNEWDTIKWPTYTLFSREDDTVHFSQSGQYMVFKINGTKISRGYSLEQCKFWSSYLPSLVDEHGIFICLYFK